MLRAARIIFLIVIRVLEVVWAIICCAGCGVNFHRFPGSFNVVGDDLGHSFCGVVSVPVFLYQFQGVVEILDRFPGVVSLLLAFPVDQEFVPVVLAAVVEYLLCFPFFGIVDQDGCWLVHSAGLESIGIVLSVSLEGGDVEVGFLAGHSGREV